MDLQGKTVIVTGAGSGIGRAISLRLAAAGAKIAAAGRSFGNIEATAAAIEKQGGQAVALIADVTQHRAVQNLVRRAAADLGPLDILINCAGHHGPLQPLWEAEPATWWQDVEVNLLGTMHCIRETMPLLLKRPQAAILNISGGGEGYARPFGTAYACSKAAVLRLTDSLAAELKALGKDHVLVLAFNPGLTETDLVAKLTGPGQAERYLPELDKRFKRGDAYSPEEVAAVVESILREAGPALAGRVLHMSQPIDEILAAPERWTQGNSLLLQLQP